MRTAYTIVKAHYDANDRRDVAGMFADIGPETVWTEMAGFPCAGTFIGPNQIIKNVFEYLAAEFENYTFKLDRLLDAGDDVVGIGDYSGTSRKTGKHFNARVVHVWTVANGQISKFEQFTDTRLVADALQ